MTPLTNPEPNTFSEFTVPNGCVLCDGTMVVRVSEKGAFSVCRSCHTMSKPKLEVVRGRITLEQKFSADA